MLNYKIRVNKVPLLLNSLCTAFRPPNLLMMKSTASAMSLFFRSSSVSFAWTNSLFIAGSLNFTEHRMRLTFYSIMMGILSLWKLQFDLCELTKLVLDGVSPGKSCSVFEWSSAFILQQTVISIKYKNESLLFRYIKRYFCSYSATGWSLSVISIMLVIISAN